MRAFLYVVTNIIFKIFYRIEVKNAGKVPEKGPVLLCANHNTMMDMFFLGFRLKRWVHWMAKDELFRNPLAAFVLRALGAFPVKRGIGDVGSIKNALRILEQGEIVGIFPQGTRINPLRTAAARVKPGAAMLAVNAGAPVLPAYIEGSCKLFGKMKIVYGDPYFIEKKPDGKYSKEEMAMFGEDIIRRIYSLAEE